MHSFLNLNELVFKPYDALDLQRILGIRVEKALRADALEPGVVEKIAALASRDHGDARQAVALLARSAYLAEKSGTRISLDLVGEAARQNEEDKYLLLIKSTPPQLQAALAAVMEADRLSSGKGLTTGEAYDAYRAFCGKVAFGTTSGPDCGASFAHHRLAASFRRKAVPHPAYLDRPHSHRTG
ncbi:MAG: hypothetical protein NTX87_06565 [Planctomycetota bacterium]|nr:hypothetical protein [Planctomycetota bacterium]